MSNKWNSVLVSLNTTYHFQNGVVSFSVKSRLVRISMQRDIELTNLNRLPIRVRLEWYGMMENEKKIHSINPREHVHIQLTSVDQVTVFWQYDL